MVKKWPSLQKPNSTLAQMALSSNQYALIVEGMEKILAQKSAPKGPEWPSYGNFCKVTQKPHFLKKCKGETKRNFSKIAQKQRSLKTVNSTLAEMAFSSNQYAIKLQRLENILSQTESPKVPEWPSYGNFRKVTQKTHFLKKCKEGPKEIFQKSPKKVPWLKKPKSTLAQIALSSNQYALKDWRRFRRKQRLKKGPNGQVKAIFARSPKTRIFRKSAKGGPREIFQKSRKKQPSFERPKRTLAQMALSPNQYALKLQRLDRIVAQKTAQKVPEWQRYGNFCKVTLNPHFLKKCKRGTKNNFSKITEKVALV